MNQFQTYLDSLGEFGIVDQINHPIVNVIGLPHAKLSEIVIFENGQIGQVFSIQKDSVEILVFDSKPIQIKTRVVRTDKPLTVPVGKELLGQTIDSLGNPISPSRPFVRPSEEREVETKALGIARRARVKRSLFTGITVVDTMIPLGKGQKELIIGDRKTGKSSFLHSAIYNQILDGSVAIYAAIARRKTDIKKLEEKLKKQGIEKNVIIVASSSYDSPSLIYLTPYTAMTIAEYFRDLGTDVFMVFDDLTSHAKFYRELSLIARRFPGRDSYPGDIFHTHAKLLERAGNFKHPEKGEVSISCFPVVETVEGDFTGYIVTNLMGITDGHIFFDSNVYYKGRRPAINIGLSVTRVGKQTQPKFKRDITRELTSFLALYEKMQNYQHFGAELTDSVKNILRMGEKVYKFFNQFHTLVVPSQVQLIVFSLLWAKFIEESDENSFDAYQIALTQAYKNPSVKEFIDALFSATSFNELLGNVTKNKDRLLALIGSTTNTRTVQTAS